MDMDNEIPKSRTLSLPALELCVTCDLSDSDAESVNLEVNGEQYVYARKLLTSPFSKTRHRELYRWNSFPAVINSDGSPWLDANLYLLEDAESVEASDLKTLQSKALNLAAFKRFLDEYGIDYLSTPKRKPERPTYAFRDSLQDQVDLGEISQSTARGRISHIKNFYTWLVYRDKYHLPTSDYLWKAKDIQVFYKDSQGFAHGKQAQTSDLKIKASRSTHGLHAAVDDGRDLRPVIEDGGKLKPLVTSEQDAMVDALLETANTLWTLVFLLALFTGARKQTILTLQVKHVSAKLPETIELVRIPVGPGTGIDTKGNKNSTILVPRWLYERLRIYCYSDVATERRDRAGDDSEEQYLFLSNRAKPFYESKAKAKKFDPKATGSSKPRGTSLNQFMNEKLLPLMREKLEKPQFRFQFHDLRATCGMNALEEQMIKVGKGEKTLTEALRFVQKLLDHVHLSTTERYLNYRHEYEEVRSLQKQHEGYLKEITDKAMSGFYG